MLRLIVGALVFVGAAAFVGQASAVTNAEKCQAAKLKAAGKYNFCRLKTDAKSVKTGEVADYSKCLDKFEMKFAGAEDATGGVCTTNTDGLEVATQVEADSSFIALKLSGVRFVDNGDETVSDTKTGLMWAKSIDCIPSCATPQDDFREWEEVYQWSASIPLGTDPTGQAFTDLDQWLNGSTSLDGTAISGCFAGYCDWRLPTIVELQTILLEPAPCDTDPCIDPVFGPTQSSNYWSSTTLINHQFRAWVVSFHDGVVGSEVKTNDASVRAVRGGR